jgi:hypothetical protein
MKVLTAIITALSVPLIILNMLGAVVSGVWLAIIGEWRPIVLGIFLFFSSSLVLGIALMPALLFAAPAMWLAERGKTFWVMCFGALSSAYTLSLVTFWCCAVLFLFVKDASSSSLIPRLIWSYGVATGPWSYMSSKEQGPDGEGFASSIATFFAQLAYLAIMLLVIFTEITTLGAIEVFGGFMLIGLAIQITLATMIQVEEKRFCREW